MDILMLRRMAALALAMVMTLSCVGTVWATDYGTSDYSGTEITSSSAKLTSGSYYLSENVTLSNSLQIEGSGTEVTLYLNGFVLTGNGADPVIRVDSTGATLNIYDVSSGTARFYDNPATTSDTSDTFTVYGGVITGGVGNSGYGGGGIMIYAGTVNLYGGNVVGNATSVADTYGGGIHIDTNGTLNMYGGSVSGNTSHSHGGGIYVGTGATCLIDGGTISYNRNNGTYGGGVYVVGSTSMSGGTIAYNSTNWGGGGLSVCGPFAMTGGTISGNVSGGAGGGALLGGNGVLTMSGDATITGNTAGGSSGGVVLSQATAALHMSGNASITGNFATGMGGGVTYTNGTVTVAGNATVTGNTVTGGYETNIYVGADKTIGIADSLTYTDDNDDGVDDTPIGVYYANHIGTVAVGSGYTILTADKNQFTSDEGYYVITRDNAVQLVEALSGTGENQSQTYSEATIDVSGLGMFDFVFEADFGNFTSADFTGTKTYTVSPLTGQGEVDGSVLKVHTVGTFLVTVTTDLCDSAPPSVQTATLTITPKPVTVSGLIGVDRRYDADDTTVAVTGGTLSGVINSDNVEIDYSKAYGVIASHYDEGGVPYENYGSSTSEKYNISIYDLALTGSKAGNYYLLSSDASGTVTISQAVPYISWPSADDITIGTATADTQLLGGKVMVLDGTTWTTVAGHFEFVDYPANTAAGTYSHEVKFVPDTDNAAYSEIIAARRTVSQIVEPAQVQFTVANDGTVTADVLDSEVSISASDYAISYATWGSDPNVTLVYAAFVDSDFRHAGTLESTGKQIGAYYTDDTDASYYDVSFTSYPSYDITDADPQDIHILPSPSGVIGWSTQWAGVTTTYDVGARFPQPSRDVTFTAVSAPSEYTLSGTVYGTDLDGKTYDGTAYDGKGLSHIGVTLMQGSELVDNTETGEDGTYTFEGVPAGKYNVVFTRDFGNRTEITIFTEVSSGSNVCNATLPDGGTDNSILYIASGMTAITVQNYNVAITNAASRLDITSVDTATANTMIEEANTIGDNMKLFYDIQLTKREDGSTYTQTDTDAGKTITYYIPLAGIYQGKDNYAVYFMDNDTSTWLDESSYTFSASGDLLTLTVSNSGVYGVYFETPVTTTPLEGEDQTVVYSISAVDIIDMGMFETTITDEDDNVTALTYTFTIASEDGDCTITADGKVTVSAVGDYTITATTPETVEAPGTIYTATLTVTPKPVTIEELTAQPQPSVINDYEGLVTMNESAYISGVEYGDSVSVNWADVIGAIDDSDEALYWEDSVLTTVGENYFDVDVTGLALAGADFKNYTLSSTTGDAIVLVYQDFAYFSWPTAKDVVYGTARTDSDLYGGKVMVERTIVNIDETTTTEWILLEGHFEWVEETPTADNAGTQSYAVKFVEDTSSANYNASATYRSTVDDTTQTITQVVQKAQVQFTVDGSNGSVSATDIDNSDATVNPSLYNVIFVNQEDSTDAYTNEVPTAEGSYLVSAEFVADEYGYINYRHAGVSDSTGKQIGGYYVDVTPTYYTVTFQYENGTTAATAIEGAVWGDIHITPTLDTSLYSGWVRVDGTTYGFGERLPQQTYDMVMTAVDAPVTGVVSGTIEGTDLNGLPEEEDTTLEKIAVTLMQGATMVDYTETDASGNYSFTAPVGYYNLVVTRDQYNVQNEMTVFITIDEDGVSKNFTLPDLTQNAELLVTTGNLDVVVQGLSELTSTISTNESATTTTVAMVITDDDDATYEVTPADLEKIHELRDANGLTADNLKLFMDVDLTQTINGVTTALTDLPTGSYLTFYIPLAGIHQGYDNYYIYRYHNGVADILSTTANGDGEYITLSEDGTYLIVKACKFSLYGVAYVDNTSGGTYRPTTTTSATTAGAELNRDDHNAYMQGYTNGTFGPDRNITRAEATVMFSRLLLEQMDTDTTYTNSFSDVTSDLWYYNNIGYMEQFGIITGYSDGTFGGSQYITRAQFAVIACRFDQISSDSASPFSDVSDDHWASDYITAAAEAGWITGYSDGTFRPDAYITRAQAVTLVNRMLERYCDEDFVDENPELMAQFSDVDSDYWAYYQIMEASHTHDYTKDDDVETWTEVLWHIQMDD